MASTSRCGQARDQVSAQRRAAVAGSMPVIQAERGRLAGPIVCSVPVGRRTIMLQIDEALRLRLASWDARPRAERSVRMLWPVEGDGWGARIRTWEWRIQSPLPYHLATPQWWRF